MRDLRAGASRLPAILAAALALGAAACDADDGGGPFGPGGAASAPREVTAAYEWVFHGWSGTRAVGQPAVQVTWDLPSSWDSEPFRVYAKRATSSSYILVATVTSCGDGVCRYSDLNVSPGQSYDYFVATEQRNGGEAASTRVTADVPASTAVEAPRAPSVKALDDALHLQWESTGAAYYQVLLDEGSGAPVLVGETDGLSFLDTRAENGTEYSYRIAAIDETGRYSDLGPIGVGTPRPDYHAELIYAQSDSLGASGFRFPASAADNPILAGTAPTAQWRLESSGGSLVIRPLGSTTLTRGVFTSQLTCGPGSDPDCESVEEAPAASSFSATAAPVEAGATYVFRVTGSDNRTHYGKIRVQGVARDAASRPVVVFDWAYQLRADSPSLTRGQG